MSHQVLLYTQLVPHLVLLDFRLYCIIILYWVMRSETYCHTSLTPSDIGSPTGASSPSNRWVRRPRVAYCNDFYLRFACHPAKVGLNGLYLIVGQDMKFTGGEILDRCGNDPSAGSPTRQRGGERILLVELKQWSDFKQMLKLKTAYLRKPCYDFTFL